MNFITSRPATTHTYRVSNGHASRFKTALNSDRNQFSFVTTSCIKLRFPYSIFGHLLRIKVFEVVSNWIASIGPSFMFVLGGFIYSEVPRRLSDNIKIYRAEYRPVYASQFRTPETRNLPWNHVI